MSAGTLPERWSSAPPAGGTAPALRAVPTLPRPAPPARRDLVATYLDHMRRRAGLEDAPHRAAHDEFCHRLHIPEHIGEPLWSRWLKHYLRHGPDWS